MAEQLTLEQEMTAICARLSALIAMDYPHYRTYQKPDGTWVEREPTPEHQEEESLIRRFWTLHAVRQALECPVNPLMVSIRLQSLTDGLADMTPPLDLRLLWRIAQSVYYNAPCP